MTQSNKISFLQQRFLESAYVKDAEKGYVVVEPFNLALDPDVLQMASRAWARHYHTDTHIDAIVGLPDAGARLVSILGEMLRVQRILPSKRTETIPGAWKDVVSYSNTSFTMEKGDVQSHIGFVKKGDTVLVVDDVIANGDTATAAISALQKAGVEVAGMCVLFDKVWQGGLEKVENETGVKPFSLIRVKEITKDGKVVLDD